MAPKHKHGDKTKDKLRSRCYDVTQGCPVILTTGCVVSQQLLVNNEEDLPLDVVRVTCTSKNCPLGIQYLHQQCYQAWEDCLVKIISNMSWARSWTDRQRRDNLWDKKGYLLIAKLCKCHCGLGQVSKDLDFVHPKKAANDEHEKPKPKRKAKQQLPSIRASDCKGILNRQLPNSNHTIPIKCVDQNRRRCSSSICESPLQFPEQDYNNTATETHTSPSNGNCVRNSNSIGNYWLSNLSKESPTMVKRSQLPDCHSALLSPPISDTNSNTSQSSNNNNNNKTVKMNSSCEWTIVSTVRRGSKDKDSRDSSVIRSKTNDNITNSEQLFTQICSLLFTRSFICLDDREILEIKARFSSKFEQVVATAGGLSKFLDEPARNLHVSKSPKTGMQIVQLLTNNNINDQNDDKNTVISDCWVVSKCDEPQLIQTVGVIQNVFEGYGFIESSMADTNIFFVPSHVKGRALKQAGKSVFPQIKDMFKTGDKVYFSAKSQEARSGCKWLAIEVMFANEKPKDVVKVGKVINGNNNNNNNNNNITKNKVEDANPLTVWTSCTNTQPLKDSLPPFEDTPPLTPSPTQSLHARYNHGGSESPVAKAIGAEKALEIQVLGDIYGNACGSSVESYDLFGCNTLYIGEDMCNNRRANATPLDVLTTPSWRRMW